MAKKFTKLFLGDVVKTIGSKSYRKLTTEQPVVEDELQGTWVFNDYIDIGTTFNYNVNFINDSVSYTNLYVSYSTTKGYRLHYANASSDKITYVHFELTGEIWWLNDKYKTITITSKLAEVTNGAELLTWLKANATKQSASTPTLISFTIGGTKYQAEEGMEWASWVGSAYNTHGYFMEGIAIYDSDYTRIYYQPYTSANITIYGSDIILANGTYGTFQSMSGGSN